FEDVHVVIRHEYKPERKGKVSRSGRDGSKTQSCRCRARRGTVSRALEISPHPNRNLPTCHRRMSSQPALSDATPHNHSAAKANAESAATTFVAAPARARRTHRPRE